MKDCISICLLIAGLATANDCIEQYNARCPSIIGLNPIRNPDTGYCNRLVAYKRCANAGEKCEDYFEQTFQDQCCGRTETEDCLDRARQTCKHALILHPRSNPDKHFCRRMRMYALCASAIHNYECKDHFVNLYFGECKSQLTTRDCMAMYSQSCFEAIRDYPIWQPDFEYCKRLVVLRKCAEEEKNKLCVGFFDKLAEDSCSPVDNCTNSLKTTCLQAEKNYPILKPDTNYCDRLRVYEICAYTKNHTCKHYFSDLFHAMCKSHEEQRDCMEIYRSTCLKAFSEYPELNPDRNYCRRLIEFEKCAESDNDKHCKIYLRLLYTMNCGVEKICLRAIESKCEHAEKEYPISNPDLNYYDDKCIDEFQRICRSGEDMYAMRIPDTNFCPRLRVYMVCADEEKHKCKKHFDDLYLEKCTRHVEVGDCEPMYLSTCYEAIRDYPHKNPDTNLCLRLAVYKTCAENYEDKHCLLSFEKKFETYCPKMDSCIEKFKIYCPKVEKDFPTRRPDRYYCKRMAAYRQCAIDKEHNCTMHFDMLHLISCEL
ncbi:uncharacterized protein LOC128248155 isoform X2 [Octopus bimaculoides]|uniref:uncharacterized protein LOC128248155 isoform X2 n=1 Tax=Octopus bimaculoides TaxID=37653 RepID=UPI0022E40EDF|nr:uncharacterized protein LOC128248155 isoform X2 [Octopus bimaculoides]